MTQQDDEENKKYRNMRIYIETLYELNKDNPQKLTEALTACAQENKRMKNFCDRLISAVTAKQEALAAAGQNNTQLEASKNAEYENIIQSLSDKVSLSTSHKNLATFLSEKRPDVKFAAMVPALEEWTFDQGKNKDAVIGRLNAVFAQKYEGKDAALEKEFTNLVAAYQNDNFSELKNLRENMQLDMKHVEMLFDIRNAICYEDGTTKSHPRSKLPRNVPMEVLPANPSRQRTPDPHNLDNVSTRDSDQWNQVLTVGAQTAHNAASNLTEGIVITALKEVMKDKYPDNFADMTLDEQEAVISSLNPAETAKVNISVLEKAQKLAEVLPPHFLTFMAKNVDKALAGKNISDDVKNALSAQKGALLTSMFNQIVSYKQGDLTANPDNAAGVYGGTTEMLSYLEDNLNTLPENRRENAKQCIEFTRNELKEAIGTYDENNGLKDVTEKDTKQIETAYDALTKHVEEIISKNEFEKSLDADTLDIFKKLEFPATKDKDGKDISAEENKKLFIDIVLHSAAQRTAVEAKDKKGEELIKAFKEQLQETAILETVKLIQAEESVKMAQDPSLADSLKVTAQDKTEEKKKKLTQYIQGLGNNPCKVSANAFAGYAAAKVCQQSLFLDRLATKIKNRGSSLLKKMWKPFEKIDQTCIKRFGKTYTAAKSLVKGSLQNLPWSIGNAVVRTAAFTQVGTPWGLAAVAGYGVYSLGTTAFRMVRQYKKMKKQDASMTVGKFFKNNWSGMALSLVGTAVSVVPGLAAASDAGWLKGALDVMRNSGALEASAIPGASHLGMTNASVGLIGAGLIDSTVRGAIAHHKNGNGVLASIGKGLGYASVSSALGIGTGIGCSMLANEVLPNQHMNMAGDVRTPEIKDGSFDPNNPDHYTALIPTEEAVAKMEGTEFSDLRTEAAEGSYTSQEQADAARDEMADMLKERGMILKEDEKGDIKISWKETTVSYAEKAVEMSQHAVEMWTQDAPEVRNENLETLKPLIAAYNKEHPEAPMDVYRAYRVMLEMGCQAVEAKVDSNQVIDKYGTISDARGDHEVITKGFLGLKVDNHNLNPDGSKTYGELWGISAQNLDDVKAVASADGRFDGTKLTPEVMKTIAKAEAFMGIDGSIGSTEPTRDISIGQEYLPSQAVVNSHGELDNVRENGTTFNTYSNVNSPRVSTSETHTSTYVVEQAHERYYMPVNPSIDLYNIAAGEGMAKIMGQNGQRKNNDVNTPVDARGLPKVSDSAQQTSDGTQRTSDSAATQAQAPAKKGNIFTRIFSRGGKDGK